MEKYKTYRHHGGVYGEAKAIYRTDTFFETWSTEKHIGVELRGIQILMDVKYPESVVDSWRRKGMTDKEVFELLEELPVGVDYWEEGKYYEAITDYSFEYGHGEDCYTVTILKGEIVKSDSLKDGGGYGTADLLHPWIFQRYDGAEEVEYKFHKHFREVSKEEYDNYWKDMHKKDPEKFYHKLNKFVL